MQKEQQKRPYLAPEIISVEFSVEKGMNASVTPDVQIHTQQELIDAMMRNQDQRFNGYGINAQQSQWEGSWNSGGYFSGGGGTYF